MIAATHLGRRLGGRWLFEGLSFDVGAGERLAVCGPSGSGKTTLLRLLAGLEAPDLGELRLGTQLASRGGQVLLPPHQRGIGFAFQWPLLWPHLTVGHNVEFGVHGLADAQRRARASGLLAECGLAGFERRDVGELSGGEAARVALARALAPRPRLLLLDEPFASVEAELRERLLRVVEMELQHSGATLVYATHDESISRCLGGPSLRLRPRGPAGDGG